MTNTTPDPRRSQGLSEATERDPGKPFCEGGAGTCEVCVGSCGVEEYEGRLAAFVVPGVKEALFLLLGGGLSDEGKEMWLRLRLQHDPPMSAEHIFADALREIDGMVAT